MKSNSARQNRLSEESKIIANEILGKIYVQAKAQFGAAVKAFWFHDGDLCQVVKCTQLGR